MNISYVELYSTPGIVKPLNVYSFYKYSTPSRLILDSPDPVEAIRFGMEQMGYNQVDLAKVVGLKSRASEILNKKKAVARYDTANMTS